MIIVMKASTPEPEIYQVSQELRRWNTTPEQCVGHHKNEIALTPLVCNRTSSSSGHPRSILMNFKPLTESYVKTGFGRAKN